MDYNIKDQIIEQDDKLRWGSLLKDLSKEGFVKKQGKIYIWIDSNKYMGKFCEFVKENLFYYPDHAFYLYFIPIFKNKDCGKCIHLEMEIQERLQQFSHNGEGG